MKRLILFCTVLTLSHGASAVVTISNVTGTFEDGETLTITASGQGAKSPAAPVIWADFASNVNPTSLGTNTSWNQNQNMTYGASAGFGGTGGAVATPGQPSQTSWTLRVDASWSAFGQKNYQFRRTKMNFLIALDGTTHPGQTANNWKTWRCYANPNAGGHPNIYFAANNGRCLVENVGQESGFWSDFNNPTTNWIAEQIIWKASSASGVKDGTLEYYVDGIEKAGGTILTYTASGAEFFTANYLVHGVNANQGSWALPAWSSSNQMWTDEVYADTTWQRVMFGDADTFADCRKFNMLIPASWSTSTIVGKASLTAFSDGEKAYVYVFDTNGVPNATGYEITVAGTVAGDPAPTGTSISHSTGTVAGGENITWTGTNLRSGCTIYFDGVAGATTFKSSTKTDVIVPAGSSGAVEDVKLINDDGQFATLLDAYTRATTLATNPPVDPDIQSQRKAVSWTK